MWGKSDGVKVTENRFGKGRVIWHSSGDEDLSKPRPSPVAGGNWIWYPEGAPASSAPPGKRTFQRTIDIENAAQLSSATIGLTADNSFEVTVNGQRVGSGDSWSKVYSFDLTKQLKNGGNQFSIVAENATNDPSPAGLIALIRLQYRDGRVVEIPTDATWQSRMGDDAATAKPALVLGGTGIGPWNVSSTVAGEQYGDFGIVSDALQEMKVPLDFESDGPIRSIHRRDGNTEIYFLANREERSLNANCSFRVAGKTPELWNPLTGERRALTDFTEKNGRTSIPLKFEAGQSWFVIFRRANRTVKRVPNFPTVESVGQINGPWQVSFDPKFGGPAQTDFSDLDRLEPKRGKRHPLLFGQSRLSPHFPSASDSRGRTGLSRFGHSERSGSGARERTGYGNGLVRLRGASRCRARFVRALISWKSPSPTVGPTD